MCVLVCVSVFGRERERAREGVIRKLIVSAFEKTLYYSVHNPNKTIILKKKVKKTIVINKL